ncbi:MAG: hypothetical protein NWE83_02425 [Candidatus Bathyarchaeota archaeon]|nr:hypothetical protein [Candidatus Bathyarchaeota archaeon]
MSEKEVKCPHCQKTIEGNDVAYCPHCGAYLEDAPLDSGWYPDDLAHGFYLTRGGRTGFAFERGGRSGFTAPPVEQYYCSTCGTYIPSREVVEGKCPQCNKPLKKMNP